jgi:tRNA(Ile)-lysidine synthase
VKAAVASYISEHVLLKAGDRVGVAVSGGADSVALLRVLLEMRSELGVVLAVVHFNHRIRGAESDADERFVCELAAKLNLPFLCGSADVPAFARQHGLGVEAAARKLRYQYFATLLQAQKSKADIRQSFPLDKIATAHTENDQAETVLMRLLRGAGTRGLGGIRTKLAQAAIVRPLLAVRRKEITSYLESIGQPWREDSSNQQLEHTRNRVRHQLIPMLERDFNPAIIHVLAEQAQIAQGEEEYWNFETDQALVAISHAGAGSQFSRLKVESLLSLPLALQRRVIRAAAERARLTLDFKHIEAVRRLTAAHAGIKPHRAAIPGGEAEIALRDGVRELMLRAVGLTKKGDLRPGVLSRGKNSRTIAANDYEYRLPVPGVVSVHEIGSQIRVRRVNVQEVQIVAHEDKVGSQEEWKTTFQRYNQRKLAHVEQLLDPSRAGYELTLRNWRPGDRFWPAHTRSPKKVKELLQKVTEAERKSWPVIVSGGRIIWMRGFPAPEEFSLPADAPGGTEGLLIEESPLAGEPAGAERA